MRKKILLSIVLLVSIGVAVGIYLYHKPRTTAASQKADFTLTATELYRQFETDEAKANQKYSGKILEVTGAVGEVQKKDSASAVLLAVPEAMGGINCSLSAGDNMPALQQGNSITIKGKCTGFLMDVNLLDAVITAP